MENQSQENILKKDPNKVEENLSYYTGRRVWTWNRLPPALTAEEELKLLRQYHEYGDRDVNIEDPVIRERFGAKDNEIMPLREVLIFGNLRLVLKYIMRIKETYSNSITKIYPDTEDLLEEGTMALMKAIDNFDPNYNFKFSTYLHKAIVSRVSRLKYQFRKIDGEQKVVLKNPSFVSLDEPLSTSHHGDVEGGSARIDFVEDEKFSWEDVDGKINEEFIRTNVLPYLSRQDRIIFESIYLDGLKAQDVAYTLGLTRQGMDFIIHDADRIGKIRRIYEEGPNAVDEATKGVSLTKKQIERLVSCQEIISKYGREFLVEKVYPRLTPTQQDTFDFAIYNYFGQSDRELEIDSGIKNKNFINTKFNSTLQTVVKIAEKILANEEKGRYVEAIKIPEITRQKVNRVERVLEKYGGKIFLDNYFLKTLPENERRAFYYGMLTYRGQNISFLAQKAGLSMKEFKTCLESATAKLKTTNFDNVVWIVDKSSVDLNILNDQENVIARKSFVDKLGARRLIKHFVPRLNETQKTVFENLYLMGRYLTAETLSKATGLTTGVIAKTELEICEMFKDLDAMEAEDKQNNTVDIYKILENKEVKALKRTDSTFVARHGGKEFLMYKFAPQLITRAEVVILRDYICGDMPARQVLDSLKLTVREHNLNSSYDYLKKTTRGIRQKIQLYKTFLDEKDPKLFKQEVEDFYKMHTYHQEHGNLDERIFGKENVDKFNHVISALMTVTTDLKKDEVDDIIKSSGGEKVLRRNFAPYKLTGITENMIFEKAILQKMSCEEIAKELNILPIEIEKVRDLVVEKVKSFIRERNRMNVDKTQKLEKSKQKQIKIKNLIEKDNK